MLLIGEIIDDMKDELCGAERYYKQAVRIKTEAPEIARKYIDLAKTELSHAMTLHTLSVDFINKLKKEEQPTNFMKEYYNNAHNYYIEKYDNISYLISKFQ